MIVVMVVGGFMTFIGFYGSGSMFFPHAFSCSCFLARVFLLAPRDRLYACPRVFVHMFVHVR